MFEKLHMNSLNFGAKQTDTDPLESNSSKDVNFIESSLVLDNKN